MKKLLILLFSLISIITFAQNGFVPVDFGNGVIGMIHAPKDLSVPAPVLIYEGGNGEIGNAGVAFNNGPARQFALGKTMADGILYVHLINKVNAQYTDQPNTLGPIIDYITSHYKTDTRWMLAGTSQGAINTFDTPGWPLNLASFGSADDPRILKFTKFVAASPCDIRSGIQWSKFKGKSVRIFHGSADGTCNPVFSANEYNALLAAGANATRTVIAGGGHDNGVWDVAFSPGTDTTNDIYKWLIGSTVPPVVPPVTPPVTIDSITINKLIDAKIAAFSKSLDTTTIKTGVTTSTITDIPLYVQPGKVYSFHLYLGFYGADGSSGADELFKDVSNNGIYTLLAGISNHSRSGAFADATFEIIVVNNNLVARLTLPSTVSTVWTLRYNVDVIK